MALETTLTPEERQAVAAETNRAIVFGGVPLLHRRADRGFAEPAGAGHGHRQGRCRGGEPAPAGSALAEHR